MKIVINALAYKQNSSGIGVLIRELLGRYAGATPHVCQVVLASDSPAFPDGKNVRQERQPWKYGDKLRRILFQSAVLGLRYCKNAVLLVTDSKIPLLLPKSCQVIPLITDLAVYRMPEVYQTSRVFLWRLQYLLLRRKAVQYLAISDFTKREMVELLQIPPEKIHVIPCACGKQMSRVEDGPQLAEVKARYGLEAPYILFVGNSNPRKNLRRIIQAFDHAKGRGDLPHQLVIAGEQGWKFNRGKALEGIVHGECVRFLEFVPDDDMPALYSSASLFLFPTLYEGFGIPILEAQACGAPVVTSKITSHPEVAGEGAVYVDPYAVEDIVQGILEVLTKPERAAEITALGYQNCARFSWEASARRLNEIIEREVGT